MKFRTALTFSMILLLATSLAAQRGAGRGGGGRGGGPSLGRPSPGGGRISPAVQRPLPSTPVAPMTNPIAPVVPYGGAARGLGTPQGAVSHRAPDRNVGRFIDRGRRDAVVVAPYWTPFYGPYLWDYTYYDPYLRPPTIPGQLPGVYPLPPEPDSSVYSPEPATAVEPEPPPPVTFFYPEPNMIVSLPEPGKEPPAIGTTREDVLARYGQPWGSLVVKGQETLFLRGGLRVILENGRVTQVR